MSQGHQQMKGSDAVNMTHVYPDPYPDERTRKRKAELERRFGSTINKYNSMYGGSNSSNEKRAAAATPALAHVPELRSLSPREVARRDTAAMGKTVEIADGSGDFDKQMVAAFGTGYQRYWKFATDVFQDSTGLRLIEEADL